MWRYTPGLDRWDKVATLNTDLEAQAVTSGSIDLCQVHSLEGCFPEAFLEPFCAAFYPLDSLNRRALLTYINSSLLKQNKGYMNQWVMISSMQAQEY